MFAGFALIATGAQAQGLQPPDSEFLGAVEKYGISQENWDTGEHAAATFPNAYRFTRHYEIVAGDGVPPETWVDETGALDLSALQANDADGPLDLETLLRDRLKNHAMVVLKDNRVLHQRFWNGMTRLTLRWHCKNGRNFGILAS